MHTSLQRISSLHFAKENNNFVIVALTQILLDHNKFSTSNPQRTFFPKWLFACMYEKLYFYLPQVKSNHADAVIFIDLGIGRVLWVVNLGVDPLALVGRIVNLPWLPLTLSAAKMGNHVVWIKKDTILTRLWILRALFTLPCNLG